MAHSHTRDLDTLPVSTLFWRYAIPSVAGMVVTGLYAIVDGVFVGHYVGSHGLAAINLAYPLVMLQVGLGAMVSMGAATRIAIRQGAGDVAGARGTLLAALALLALLGAAIPLAGLPNVGKLLEWLQADGQPEVAAQARAYLWWMLAGAALTMGQMLVTYLVRNDGRPDLATALTILGALLNIPLNFLLVGGLGLGLAGSAIGTLLAESVVVALGLGYFFTRHAAVRLRVGNMRLDKAALWPILALGAPSLLMELNLALLLYAHNHQLLRWGDDLSVAAYAVAGYTEALFTLAIHGLAVGMQPLLGHATGAGQPGRAREALLHGVRVGLALGLAALAAVQLFPAWIAGWYSDGSQDLVAAGSHALRLHLLAMPLDGLVVVGCTALQAMALTRLALGITISKTLLLLPTLGLMPLWLGVDGVWLAMPLVNLLLGLLVGGVLLAQSRRLLGAQAAAR
ncbi:MATE family efflux transporter [Chromobacterium subtsugae]|uniref:MATE family efflux transporter n=1 Tax=Chromobacterium subtsugae TaxID=251747 RepID=A0ABS7FG78_9NEIS|nr:MATE family efflux transporter [Chromobacterium subtsugae]MBW7567859.1 MATE family efflux transporter [Chromobacterium subtsugae]MBW8289086.1 MATE family efflux transporter [Chromobacterium subtsugae]WSE93770.1 MATE family efflux transporter [Chromobacterium subtsugae]WVH62147.1 MATE family efflux transporter [Chromobacterium subtsugae]